MEFEFGQTAQSEAFFDRNPEFVPSFEKLMDLANKCFGRVSRPKNRLEDLCFSLGHTCREDFLEVTFLAVNGYGSAASKILRGLYERAVALAYMIKHPEKTERFVRFAAIQEHRAMESALRVVSEVEFDKAMSRTTTAAEVRKLYKQVKPEFQMTLCEKCGTTRTQSSWDLDIAAMVQKVGEPFDQFYLGAYTIPNFQIHATLASAFEGKEESIKAKESQREAQFAMIIATVMLIAVIRCQNNLFILNIDSELDACEKEMAEMWSSRIAQDHASQPH